MVIPVVDASDQASGSNGGDEPVGSQADLGGWFGQAPEALFYLVAIVVFLAIVFLLTRLLVPGPLES